MEQEGRRPVRAGLGRDPLAPQLRRNAQRIASRWWLYLLLGLAAVVVGILLLANLSAAVTVLAVLAGISLLVTGLLDLFSVDRFRPRWLGVLSGIAFTVAGVLALVWPKATLWVIAVVVGLGLLVGGVFRVGGALTGRDDKGWWIVLIGGLVSLIAGILALAWPRATIVVLGLLLGARTLILGLLEISFAWSLRRLGRQIS